MLAGTIGAGKTSLTQMLSTHLGTPAYYESVDNNRILPLFYQDPKKYAFLLQIDFLNRRMADIKKAWRNEQSVLDRSIFEDSLLFHLNADLGRATETEVAIYDSLLQNMMQELPSTPHSKNPDLLIHIDISFDTMLARIKKRGRPFEQIANDPSLYQYYKDLNQRYQTWYQNYDKSAKIQINGDKYDFVEKDRDKHAVFDLIDQKISQLAI
ncbi:deoxyguanosine kinase [Lentilactobacillus parafarraginis DSM 18390 = JCM 14109]|uniref:Deoxyguanosine kinase n=1 Tax=Lentilactobacillus parafarraginis DSM 18390 = JCM 14109 TaxID=1423786 RepID=A0A0R1YVH4_9LACO|nr:deoxyguanosine kinase [Lentilactobacillus parafarraginis DSM 18390 = JCM 14109]